MEKTGRALDGSALEEKTIFVYRTAKTADAADGLEVRELRNRAGEWYLSVSLDRFPMARLRGTSPDAKGGFTFTSLEYLAGSVSGWNEYSLELFGTGTLTREIDQVTLSVREAPETAELVRGRIHRYDTRITGDEALTGLRARRSRILALVEWMAGRENTPKGLDRKDFEQYWKPILLPEMVSAKKRPELWLRPDDLWIEAEDIRWNTGYTERNFPEELRPIRNSGTLLRDWEEALDWLYLEYEWEEFAASLSREHILRQIK
jgi:hypothetical protein